MAIFSTDGEEEVSRTIRDEPPTHFSLKIKSFSLLSSSSNQSCLSNFKAGGYTWKLFMYPKGNKDRDGEGHISLYLEILQTNSLSRGWEVHAFFRLFLLDQLRDKYLTLQDANGRARRFRATKTRSGFDRFITLKEFNDPSEGYLINDTCVFGAEVYVHRESAVRKECCILFVKPETNSCFYTWKIEKFSELVEECYSSEVFTAGGHRWKLYLWPKGEGEAKGKSISLFLVLEVDPKSLIQSQGASVEAKLGLKNKFYGYHVERKLRLWFDHSSSVWGWHHFQSFRRPRDQSKGNWMKDIRRDFLPPKDVCIIEAHLVIEAIQQPSGKDFVVL